MKTNRPRITFIFFICCIVYAIIGYRLYYIQIAHHDFYAQLGTNQYNTTVTIAPARAAILDRSGKQFLALNTMRMAAFCLPSQIKDRTIVRNFLVDHFPSSVQRFDTNHNQLFMYVERRLSDEQIMLIQNSNIPDIHLLQEPSRYYPCPYTGHITGITNVDNVGIMGIELLYNIQLAGTPSSYLLEKDARSGHYHFTKTTKQQGHVGQAIQLTIDSTLQFLVHEELQKTVDQFQAQEGAAIILNPLNGEILAMACIPTFDPNNTKSLNMAYTKNRLITESYELGSVIKVFAALAALDEHVVTLDEPINCDNVVTSYVQGRKINTVRSSVAGEIPFCQVIEKSNNIGIAKVVTRLGPKLYDHYIRLGFGTKTGIEFPGEQSGFVNPPENWSKQSIFSLSYGYEINATLLQLACAFAIIANNGYAIQPTLIMDQKKPTKKSEKLYSDETLANIRQILENTVLRGSAKKAQMKGYTVLGKTGTAKLLDNGSYSDTKNMYTCVGLVQKGEYQRVIVTCIKESPLPRLYASTVAVPLFERIAGKTVIHDKII
ncbi:MAG TPA: penicillin-binding protein 2 [Candidatus Babeliales bacterium]|nr:penicillin-binding protein 2 [Candidatus Babeliales bacterium]